MWIRQGSGDVARGGVRTHRQPLPQLTFLLLRIHEAGIFMPVIISRRQPSIAAPLRSQGLLYKIVVINSFSE